MRQIIPGSEKFGVRPEPAEVRRGRISPKLRLHTVSQEAIDAVSPAVFEIIRHRLWAITEEMGETLKRMSGSYAVTESNDFDFSVCDELGDQVQVGLYNTGLVGAMDLAVYWTLEHRSDNPGIEPGDMFLCNDPWVGGGLHQNDAAVLCPIFHEGELFGWTTAICHQLDVGGAAPGSWSPSSPDVFSEGVPTPPVKIVRQGILQEDVADVWVRRSRLPQMVGLDLRAKVASNLTATKLIGGLIDRYGADVVKAVMKGMMDDAESRLRTKLRGLPDGTWSAVGYQEQSTEGDRGVHPITLSMTKQDDRLIFDFTGTAAQQGMINCAYPGLRGGIVFTLLPLLAGDIPWAAGGLLRCIDIRSEEGTLNNAMFPAAVGKGPLGPGWVTGNLVAECLGKLLDSRPETRRDVQSVCAGTYDGCGISGMDERGDYAVPFMSGIFDSMASGFGAQVEQDGVDTGGFVLIPQGRAPDVEMSELVAPLLYLWRREEIDSGGPGRMRGGMSGSICLAAHGTATPMGLMFTGGGKAVSQNVGLSGGHPGNTQIDLILRGSAARGLIEQGRVPGALDELGGEREVVQCEGSATLNPTDVFYMHWQAGGGYGDPLLRDPAAVVRDIAALSVSERAAWEVYGVVAPGGELDEAATEARRAELRRERVRRSGGDPDALTEASAGSLADSRVDDNVVVVRRDGAALVACGRCGRELGSEEDYAESLLRYEGPPGDGGPQIWNEPGVYVDSAVVFRQLCCPGCATAIQSGVVPVDHPLHVGRRTAPTG